MKRYILAEFMTPRDLVEGARVASLAGWPAQDALSPNPVKEVVDYLAPPIRQAPIGWVMFAAATIGALGGYAMQWYSAVIDYPISSGGRPLHSWPAFLLVPYETGILAAGVVGTLAWLGMCGFPKLFHPLFESQVVKRVSQDRYVLVFPFDENRAGWISTHLRPVAVHESNS